MSRYTLPGTNRIIYVLKSGETEVDCDIQALEEILDKTEEEINKIRIALNIIKENPDEYSHLSDPNLPT